MSVQVSSLISYVNMIKPFHTKILGVEISYVVKDSLNVSFVEDLQIETFMGIPTEYYLPEGSRWDSSGYDQYPFDCSIPRIVRGINYDEVFAGNAPSTAKWDGVAYDATEWDSFFDPSYLWVSGKYPHVDGTGSGLVDGIHVSFVENLSIDVGMFDTYTEKPQYIQNFDRWDENSDLWDVVDHGSNWIILRGDRVQTFTLSPLLVFEIIGGTITGTYTCISATLNANGSTTIVVAETIVPVGTGALGTVDLGFWDSQGWDDVSWMVLPNTNATFPLGSTFNEELSITEGIGWDQSPWDDTSGVYTGTNANDVYLADFWEHPGKWDDGRSIISSVGNRNFGVGLVDSMPWDQGYFGQLNMPIDAGVGVHDFNGVSLLQETHKRVLFSTQDGPVRGKMTEIHLQETLSSVWTFTDTMYGIGSFIAYNEFGIQIQWVTCESTPGHTITMTFDTPYRGYVLGE